MVYLRKKETGEITKALSKINNKKITKFIKKINSSQKIVNYIYHQKGIRLLLMRAFKEKKKIKINYYSLSSDEVKSRMVDIYQLHDECIVAYCNLRKEERTFVIRRIKKAMLLDEKYKIPRGWTPESIIINK